MEYSIPNSVQQIPGFEKLQDIQPLINPNYYQETAIITETEYYPDGTVKTFTRSDQSLNGIDLQMMQGNMAFVDPNLIGTNLVLFTKLIGGTDHRN